MPATLPEMPALPDSVRAMVLTGVRRLELTEFPMPEYGDDAGILRMEVCGICGSDYEQFNGEFAAHYPVIPGHEPVGRIAALGARARANAGALTWATWSSSSRACAVAAANSVSTDANAATAPALATR